MMQTFAKVLAEERIQKLIPNSHLEDGLHVVISDLHIPYHIPELVMLISEQYSSQARSIIIDGDLIDAESISKFKKTGRIGRLCEAYETSKELVWSLARQFPRVDLIEGNHEFRTHSGRVSLDDAEFSFFDSFDMLEHIASGDSVCYDDLSQETILQRSTNAPSNVSYQHSGLINYNNGIFIGHPHHYSKIQARTVINTIQDLKLERTDISNIDAVIIGHTHKIVNGIYTYGVTGYEIGCLCGRLKYAKNTARQSRPAWGFMLMYIKDGKIDTFSSKVVNLSSPEMAAILL